MQQYDHEAGEEAAHGHEDEGPQVPRSGQPQVAALRLDTSTRQAHQTKRRKYLQKEETQS